MKKKASTTIERRADGQATISDLKYIVSGLCAIIAFLFGITVLMINTGESRADVKIEKTMKKCDETDKMFHSIDKRLSNIEVFWGIDTE